MRARPILLLAGHFLTLGCRDPDQGDLTEPPDGSHCGEEAPDWCEQTCVDVSSDPQHCGACGQPCETRPNVKNIVCASGACVVGKCEQGFDNCDRDDTNGCEVELATSAAHCGACGVACATQCVGGTCDDPIEVSAGPTYTCAVRALGAVWCWGANAWGNLGTGKPGTYPVPVRVELPARAIAVSAGRLDSRQHTCALLEDGAIHCWGANGNGQLGTGNTFDSSYPLPVELPPTTQIAAGGVHTCAVSKTRQLHCWGSNGSGQLGLTNFPDQHAPWLVTTAVQEVALGANHTCARLLDQTTRCWGANSSGQVGNGFLQTVDKPAVIPSAAGALALQLGAAHSCALFEGGGMKCWGEGQHGQLGLGTTEDATTPQLVPLMDVEGFAVGALSSAAIVAGTVLAWGANDAGQLGTGDTAPALVPVSTKIGPVKRLAFGRKHGCAIRPSGELVCWGANADGQLGTGNQEPAVLPVPVVFPMEDP